jgi:hypothetical protein
MRPDELRPALFFLDCNNERSGLDLVISSKVETEADRLLGVVGLKVLIGI